MKIYSRWEYEAMIRFQKAKDAFFAPLAKTLSHHNVSPNAVSVLSGAVAGISLVFSIGSEMPVVFVVGIWLHLFLDGLDGVLARAVSKEQGITGLALDLLMDSVGIVTMGFYLSYFGIVSPHIAALFVCSYLTVNAISYVFAKTGREYTFVIRPRIFIIIALTLDYAFLFSATPVIVAISTVLLLFFVVTGLIVLLRR